MAILPYVWYYGSGAVKKMTFTLDDGTAHSLERASHRLGIPKSQVVREAVQMYGEQLGRLSDEEVQEKLRVFDDVMSGIPRRPAAEVDAEVEAVRAARRGGGRQHGSRET